MTEIKSLTIENFQSHQKSSIEPAPTGKLTVIVGPSDSGKTAIIRALKWLYYNKPQGSDFTRVGASVVRVSLQTSEGIVGRQRSAGVNRYTVIDGRGKDAQTTLLEGFGVDVPLEVQEITGVRQTMIGDLPLNLNLAEQLDGPFLGSGISDPVRARVLGKLAGTEEVDHANKTLGTDLYRRNQDLKNAKADVERLTEELKQFEHLPRLRELAGELGRVIERATVRINTVRALRLTATLLRERQEQARGWQGVVARLAKVDDAEKAKDQVEGRLYARVKLFHIGNELLFAGTRKADAGNALQRLWGLDSATADVSMIDSRHGALSALRATRDRLHRAEDAKWAAEDRKDKLAMKIGWTELDLAKGTELVERRRELWDAKKQFTAAVVRSDASMGFAESTEAQQNKFTKDYQDALLSAGICPTCGNDKIDPEKLKGVV